MPEASSSPTVAAPEASPRADVGFIARLAGMVGVWIIHLLIIVFGRTRRRAGIAWLDGPIGGAHIGDAPYAEVARSEGLVLERQPRSGGLVPDFTALDGPELSASRTHPLVRAFYERTSAFSMDVWSRTYFPANVGLWLLVTTISRQVEQLNFPLSPLDTANGISSDILLLRDRDGRVKYTGWFRKLARDNRVLYTGFYMTARVPGEPGPCVKVVFPMPDGNATVILRPRTLPDGGLELESSGSVFGGAGFYRVTSRSGDRVRVWQVKSLRETFHLYVDERQVLRCDHTVRFLGLPVIQLHYKMIPGNGAGDAPVGAPPSAALVG